MTLTGRHRCVLSLSLSLSLSHTHTGPQQGSLREVGDKRLPDVLKAHLTQPQGPGGHGVRADVGILPGQLGLPVTLAPRNGIP